MNKADFEIKYVRNMGDHSCDTDHPMNTLENYFLTKCERKYLRIPVLNKSFQFRYINGPINLFQNFYLNKDEYTFYSTHQQLYAEFKYLNAFDKDYHNTFQNKILHVYGWFEDLELDEYFKKVQEYSFQSLTVLFDGLAVFENNIKKHVCGSRLPTRAYFSKIYLKLHTQLQEV